MKQDWHPDELAQHWTLSAEERELLDSKTSAALAQLKAEGVLVRVGGQ
jgi:hypothetical protein